MIEDRFQGELIAPYSGAVPACSCARRLFEGWLDHRLLEQRPASRAAPPLPLAPSGPLTHLPSCPPSARPPPLCAPLTLQPSAWPSAWPRRGRWSSWRARAILTGKSTGTAPTLTSARRSRRVVERARACCACCAPAAPAARSTCRAAARRTQPAPACALPPHQLRLTRTAPPPAPPPPPPRPQSWFDDRVECRNALSKLSYLTGIKDLNRDYLPWTR